MNNNCRIGLNLVPRMISSSLSVLFVIIMCFVSLIKSMNLMSGFPDDLYVSKDDTVGFLVSNFVNGTRL